MDEVSQAAARYYKAKKRLQHFRLDRTFWRNELADSLELLNDMSKALQTRTLVCSFGLLVWNREKLYMLPRKHLF